MTHGEYTSGKTTQDDMKLGWSLEDRGPEDSVLGCIDLSLCFLRVSVMFTESLPLTLRLYHILFSLVSSLYCKYVAWLGVHQ